MTPIRVTDLAITPDFTRLVTIGMDRNPTPAEPPARPGTVAPASSNNNGGDQPPPSGGTGGAGNQGGGGIRSHNKMIIYDLGTKQPEL